MKKEKAKTQESVINEIETLSIEKTLKGLHFTVADENEVEKLCHLLNLIDCINHNSEFKVKDDFTYDQDTWGWDHYSHLECSEMKILIHYLKLPDSITRGKYICRAEEHNTKEYTAQVYFYASNLKELSSLHNTLNKNIKQKVLLNREYERLEKLSYQSLSNHTAIPADAYSKTNKTINI